MSTDRPPRRAGRAGRLALALWLAGAACGPGPDGIRDDGAAALDLLAELPFARFHPPALRLDLADPSSLPALLSGWGPTRPGQEARWSDGLVSRVEAYLPGDRAYDLIFECAPFAFPDAPEQRLTVSRNGSHVVTLPLAPGFRRYTVPLSPSGSGRWSEIDERTVLTFGYAYTRQPRDVSDSLSWRELAVSWRSLSLLPRGAPAAAAPPRVDLRQRTLWLPAGSRLDFFLMLRAGDRLLIDNVSGAEGKDLFLGVLLQTEGGAENSVLRAGQDGPIRSSNLLPAGEALARLSLLVRGGQAAGRGIQLTGPRLLHAERPTRPAAGVTPAGDRSLATDQQPAAGQAPAAAGGPPPSIVLFVVDTLRADHLGCYGYARPTSPAIDAFAASATRFDRAWANSAWTRSSMASLLTGLPPLAHGVRQREDALPGELVTLAERLREAGYRTGACVTNGNVSKAFGFDQGFESFAYLRGDRKQGQAHARGELVNRVALTWLDGLQPGVPFFLLVHLMEPHSPYAPPQRLRSRFAPDLADNQRGTQQTILRLRNRRIEAEPGLLSDMVALYDGEVAAADAAFGAFHEGLRQRGLLDTTIVVFTADHGEELYDHQGWGHGRSLHEEVLRVPLLVRFEGQATGAVRSDPVQLADLMPTLLARAGLPVPVQLRGRLAPPDGPSEVRPLFSFVQLDGFRAASVMDGRFKLVRPGTGEVLPGLRLYDLLADPAERENLVETHPVQAGYLLGLLAREEQRTGLAARARKLDLERDVDPALLDSLRAIGYLR